MKHSYFYSIKPTLIDESAPKTWVELFKEGVYKGYTRAPFKADRKMLLAIVDNFKNANVSNQVPVHLGHPQDEAEALGWVRDLKEENGILKGLIEFTEEFADKIKKGLWKFVSIELEPNMVHPNTAKELGPYLYGVGITNNPFIRGLAPIQLADEKKDEQLCRDEYLLEENRNMDKVLELLKKVLGVEELSEEQALEMLAGADAEMLAKCLRNEYKAEEAEAETVEEDAAKESEEEEEESEGVVVVASDDAKKLSALQIANDVLRGRETELKAQITYLETLAEKQIELEVGEHIKCGRVRAGEKEQAKKLMALDRKEYDLVFPKETIKEIAMKTFSSKSMKEVETKEVVDTKDGKLDNKLQMILKKFDKN